MNTRSIAETVCERIAYEIAAGKHRPGDRLPSVRALAVQHRVNPSTIQIVLGRLQQTGLVEPHPGIGFVVRDIDLLGGIEVWKYLFRFAQKLPDRATAILRELLAMRLTLTIEALGAVAKAPEEYDFSTLRRAVDQLEFAVAAVPIRVEQVARAEQHAGRMLLASIRQTVLLAMFNTISDIIIGAPIVLDAMYEDPHAHLALWKGFLGAWQSRRIDGDVIEGVRTALRMWDDSTVNRFRALVAESR